MVYRQRTDFGEQDATAMQHVLCVVSTVGSLAEALGYRTVNPCAVGDPVPGQ